MGKRGPAKTPTAQLKLAGSWRGELNKNEPRASTRAPSCPAMLDKYGKAEWRRMVKSLTGMQILSADDRALMIAYCVAWSDFVRACEDVKKSMLTTLASGSLAKHPSQAIKEQASARLLRLGQQFGLSPSARSSIEAPEREPKRNDKTQYFSKGAG